MHTPSMTNHDDDIRVDLCLENVGPLLQLTWARGSRSSLDVFPGLHSGLEPP